MSYLHYGDTARVGALGWAPFQGFTLISPLGGTSVRLIDMKGDTVHSWRLPGELGGDAVLLPSGCLLCALKVRGAPLAEFEGATGRLVELDWDGEVVWQHDDEYMHHHFSRVSSGNTWVLRWVATPASVAATVKGGLAGKTEGDILWGDSLQEIAPTGRSVREWFTYEHLDPTEDVICPLCFRNQWPGTVSFAFTPEGNVALSLMRTNSIAVVDGQSGSVLWRWGGFMELGHPLAVTCLDTGEVAVLGNSMHAPGMERGHSEVLVISPKTSEITWQFTERAINEFYTSSLGSLQRLSNGNILITESDQGRVFEVTEAKEVVWEFINPIPSGASTSGQDGRLAGAYRYGPEYEGFKGRSLPSKGPRAFESRLANLGY